MDQKSRTETLDAFKTGKLQLLIASDVAARGLDIPAVSHVFNFDVPTHAEDYIHRIGRTGRAGRSGISITLATPADGKYLDAITHMIQHDIPQMALGKGGVAAEPEGEARAERAPRDREPRGEREPRRGDRDTRHRGRGQRPAAEATPALEPAPRLDTAPQPDPAPRREPAPRPAAPAQQSARRPAAGGSPFGSDGPVPAFLLRPSGAR
jgi:superfamily II DNA/RNA helicase